MLQYSQVYHSPCPAGDISLWQKPLLIGAASTGGILPVPAAALWRRGTALGRKQNDVGGGAVGWAGRKGSNKVVIRAVAAGAEKSVTVKAVVTVKTTVGGSVSHLGLSGRFDDVKDLFGRSLHLELASAELDPTTGLEKKTIRNSAHFIRRHLDEVKYEAKFKVPAGFGEVGAVLVENDHRNEMFFKDIVLNGFSDGAVQINCQSWVHSKYDNHQKRVFFTSKSYLPSKTPDGLKKLRENELWNLRGNGQGERKSFERIYDYDMYNDIGDGDKNEDLARPVLGGKELPYPRRCRTGRPRNKKDPLSEKRESSIYVPRDEDFSELKQANFSSKALYSVLHAVVPSLGSAFADPDRGFPNLAAINSLFVEGLDVSDLKQPSLLLNLLLTLPRFFSSVTDAAKAVFRFEVPELFRRDKLAWFRDEEFARETLAGVNPYVIKLVTEWPLRSKLDPEIYGPPESAIKTEMIEQKIEGFANIDEAIKNKKVFILDYHDAFLPYVNKVREIKGATLYASRTLFFLTPDSTLKPLAIELTRPPSPDGTKPQWKQAFYPSSDSASTWLWRLAKVHVLAHDSSYHQLISHWLRTHCVTEPYIIATNRQLSEMHPINRLLQPYFRYTMQINALARQSLVNAGGIFESAFAPVKYSLEMSAAIYDKQWRFDKEGLPADLIDRGLAVEDTNAPHGLKLMIEDYPFANDGLVLWDAIKEWVTDYVNHYYPDPDLARSDQELQAWWTEIRTKGHEDKKEEPWWPVLDTSKDLVDILTTIIWVTSGHHAAVNFGQYHFAGYFPNRPSIARTNMPSEDPTDDSWKFFMQNPEDVLMDCFPSQVQATKVMAVLDVLSNHSPDEEYIGETPEPSWTEEAVIKSAFEKFTGKLKELEAVVDARNDDAKLRNRNGVGIVPYELLKPFSKKGVTGMGVPNSISI